MKHVNLLRLLGVVGISTLCACAAAPPVGYTGGVRWNVPLVAPLDGAELVIPAMVHDQGPFLFLLNPDQQVSLIDRGVADSLKLFTPPDSWKNLANSDDNMIPARPYEVMRWQAGDLSIRNVRMYSVKAGSMWYRGMPLAGVLGTDLLSRTIVLDVDRDRGMVHLSLTGHHVKPNPATRVKGRVHRRRFPIRKVVVPVTLERNDGPRQIELAVDLSAQRTAVWNDLLPSPDTPLVIGDERVEDLQLDGYSDMRPDAGDYDGILGQDILSRYRVTLDQDRRVLWLAPRPNSLHSMAAERISRWGDTFARCQVLGCVSFAHDASGGLLAKRDPQAPAQAFEVVLEALDAQGQPLPGLLRTRVDPGEVTALSDVLANFPGQPAASYRVVDASPHVASRPTLVSTIAPW